MRSVYTPCLPGGYTSMRPLSVSDLGSPLDMYWFLSVSLFCLFWVVFLLVGIYPRYLGVLYSGPLPVYGRSHTSCKSALYLRRCLKILDLFCGSLIPCTFQVIVLRSIGIFVRFVKILPCNTYCDFSRNVILKPSCSSLSFGLFHIFVELEVVCWVGIINQNKAEAKLFKKHIYKIWFFFFQGNKMFLP